VEGKFGNCKRKGTLGRIMAKLADTSESVIHVGIIVLNLDKWLAELLLRIIQQMRIDAVIPLSENDEMDSALLQCV
tara:strand:- start:778 stop:1005 length:228 start_codon:yes stop_codon:yes gene_type:complete